MRTYLFTLLLFAVAPCDAQGCAATPEAAAAGVLGTPVGTHITDDSGYRVQDIQVDPVMHRMWVRVSRCGEPSAPLTLVPLRAALAGDARPARPAPSTPSANTLAISPVVDVAAPLAVHAGDAVKAFFASDNVHMELDATANGQAAVGGAVEITLARRGDEPAHRMRGVLRAQGRVEVRP